MEHAMPLGKKSSQNTLLKLKHSVKNFRVLNFNLIPKADKKSEAFNLIF